MNQLVPVQPQAPVQTFTMTEMERVALAIAKGRLFGSDDPNAVLTLCMVAQAEGKHPGLVLQQYHIIKGKPAKKAEAMLVDFIAAGGRVTWNRLDDECADATFSHPLGGEVTINWTIARATKAGLLGNDTWKKYPRQMLRSRVVSEGVRTVFPGATSGMYVPEELQDFDEPARSATPPTPQPKRARDLKPEPKPEPETPLLEKHDPETGEVTEQPAPKAKQTAESWTNEYIGQVRACESTDDLIALQTGAEKSLAKLKTDKPELWELATNAGTQRAGELQGASEEFAE